MMLVLASSDGFSSSHSGSLLQHLLNLTGWQPSHAQLEAINHLLRKCGHLSAYGLHAWLWRKALRQGFNWRAGGMAFGGSLLMASWDEWHQSAFASRTGTPVDVGIDALGALMALILDWLWQKWRLRPPNNPRPS